MSAPSQHAHWCEPEEGDRDSRALHGATRRAIGLLRQVPQHTVVGAGGAASRFTHIGMLPTREDTQKRTR
jgi:hypothetical protein